MQLHAITNRTLFSSVDALLKQAALWASSGVDFVQVREKDLKTDELVMLASKIVSAVRSTKGQTRVFLNGSAEIAIATGCDGVHLTSNHPESAIENARAAMSRNIANPIISVSCHTFVEVERARDHGATLALFAPVFEKKSGEEIVTGQGLDALAAACRIAGPMPVFALGGITGKNARDCIRAGAAGIAAIRLFVSGNWLSLR